MVSTKKLLLLAVGLSLLAGIGQWWQHRNQQPREGRMRKAILSMDAVSNLDQVVISKGALTLHIRLVDGVWRLAEKNEFPAKGQQLLDFIGILTAIRPADLISEDPARLKDFNLLEPDGASEGAFGIQVQLLAGQTPVLDLVLGDERPSQGGAPGGRYIRLQGEPQVYLIKEEINIPYMAEDWMQTSLLQLPEAELRSLSIQVGAKRLDLQRPTGEADFAQGGKAVNMAKLRGVLTELGNLTLLDALPLAAASQLKLQEVAQVNLTLADGSNLGFALYTEDLKDERNHYLKFTSANAAATQRFGATLELGKTWVFELQEWQLTKWTQLPDQLQATP